MHIGLPFPILLNHIWPNIHKMTPWSNLFHIQYFFLHKHSKCSHNSRVFFSSFLNQVKRLFQRPLIFVLSLKLLRLLMPSNFHIMTILTPFSIFFFTKPLKILHDSTYLHNQANLAHLITIALFHNASNVDKDNIRHIFTPLIHPTSINHLD